MDLTPLGLTADDSWSVGAAAGGNFQYAVALVAAVESDVRRGDVEGARALASAKAFPPGLRPLHAAPLAWMHSSSPTPTTRLLGTRGSTAPSPPLPREAGAL